MKELKDAVAAYREKEQEIADLKATLRQKEKDLRIISREVEGSWPGGWSHTSRPSHVLLGGYVLSLEEKWRQQDGCSRHCQERYFILHSVPGVAIK